MQNYQSAWSWDIFSLCIADEMVKVPQGRGRLAMERDQYLEEVHLRILRVTEDLRVIQRELNCAAMEAPGDPELMEALNRVPEMDSLEMLKSALDQMRHFLWFYMQVMTQESEFGDKLRETIRQRPSHDVIFKSEAPLNERLRNAAEALMLHYLADGKVRKPN